MKYFNKFIFAFIIFFIVLPNVDALNGYVTSSALRVRDAATVNSNIIYTAGYGETLNLRNDSLILGDGCAKGWYTVNYNGITGYICSDYVGISSSNGYNTSTFTARVYATTLSARSIPSSSGARQDTLIHGTNVLVTEILSPGSGCESSWYKIMYHDGQIGFVCSKYIINKSDITASDDTYSKTLESLGFPSSYWPYLTYLHSKYPNWNFKAINTGLNWDDVINGESGKNYIEGTIYNSYRTDANPREGSNWFESTDGVNAYFLDPRNFLTEKYIFMFENLQYDETTQGSDVIKSIFGSGYLSNDEYINYFIEAGVKFNISPVHLASRVVQEGGARSDYSAITGTSSATYQGQSLTGYYNYYNIGAYADSYTNSPVTRGLAYAKGITGGSGTSYGRPWDTRKKAIFGGAEFISSGYICEGQYTLYFQKFNTSPTSGYNKYTHQYMTNVQAPSSEGSNIYNSYKDNGIINLPYVFAIPVYNNMPENVSLPTIGDIVNSLSAITINGLSLTGFDPDVVSYAYYVTKDVNEITIGANATSSLSSVEGTGNIKLENDTTKVTLKVTSQTGEIKSYEITITKVSDNQTVSEILSNIDVKINNEYMGGLSSGTSAAALLQSIQKYGPSSLSSLVSSTGLTLNGANQLATGQILTITSTSNESKTYNIVVKGDSSGDGNITILDLLQIQKHILNSKKLNGAYCAAADTSGDQQVTILDLLQVQKHILGVKKL